MLAVLLDAIAQLGSRRAKRVAETEEWIIGESDGDLPFSFRNVCEVLGVEPRLLRRSLLASRPRSTDATLRAQPTRASRRTLRDFAGELGPGTDLRAPSVTPAET
jgi:hypothetical protein